MSLNWKEIELVLSELPLKDSRIVSLSQNSFHGLTWILFHPNEGQYAIYTETGTMDSRIHKTSLSRAKQKLPKLQRFIQFTRKNLESGIITEVTQAQSDRLVCLEVRFHNEQKKVFLRFYSGPSANIIITDSNNKILELQYRRPNRDEVSGKTLNLEPKTINTSTKEFTIRPRIEGSFNDQLELQYNEKNLETKIETLKKLVNDHKIKEMLKREKNIQSLSKRKKENEDYQNFKEMGDILSSNFHLLKNNASSITLKDFDSKEITILLKSQLSPSQNINFYYEKAKKSKNTWLDASKTLEEAIIGKEKRETYYQNLLKENDDLKAFSIKLSKALKEEKPIQQKVETQVGLICISHGFTILIGRTAKENDFLLRHQTRGNDYWFHTRDYPGGYVFIKNIRNKSIPLDTLLDAANLAVLFSKGKNAGKIDLYYTQVKYLRRAKNGPLGLVLPTNEKNLCIDFNKLRAQQLLEK
ncbi:MAG: NFACT RNA binding domain-containing protein [Sphaerochaetaceae bacterium]